MHRKFNPRRKYLFAQLMNRSIIPTLLAKAKLTKAIDLKPYFVQSYNTLSSALFLPKNHKQQITQQQQPKSKSNQ